MKQKILLHRPLWMAMTAAVAPYLACLFYQAWHTSHPLFVVEWLSLIWFAGGIFYNNVFEYLWHRFAFHAVIPGLGFVRKSHADHHRYFCDDYFARDDQEALEHIVTKWYVFPVLYFIHYFLLFPSRYYGYAQIFFLGVLVRFLFYEATHWFTHVKDNGFDRAISRLKSVPILRWVTIAREDQIMRHRRHHDFVKFDFSFGPFYFGPFYHSPRKPRM